MIEAWIVGLGVGYLLGSIPTGLWLGRWRGGVDIRTSGSGRTGATNTLRSLGARWSATVLVIDALKGAVPILIVMAVWDSPTGEVLAGLAAIVGHQFPLLRGLQGRARRGHGDGRVAADPAVRAADRRGDGPPGAALGRAWCRWRCCSV